MSAGADQCIRLWDTTTGKELRKIVNPAVPNPNAGGFDSVSVVALSLSPDEKVLASGSNDTTVRLWDVTSGKELRCLRGHTGCVFAVRFSSDGKLLASGANDGTLRLWAPETGKEIRQLQGSHRVNYTLALSPDGKIVAAGLADEDSAIILWDTATGKTSRSLGGHNRPVLGLEFSPDGQFLASGSLDGTLCVWELSTGREVRRFGKNGGWINTVAFSPDGKTLVAGCQDQRIRRWDIATGREGRALGESEPLPEDGNGVIGDGVRSLAFLAGGKILASAARGCAIRCWDVASGRDLTSGHRMPVGPIAFCPDGQIMVSGGADETLRRWDVKTGEELSRFAGGAPGRVWVEAVSPGAGMVAFGGVKAGTIGLWDGAKGKELCRLADDRGKRHRSMTFSPNGRILAVADYWGDIRLWDTATTTDTCQIKGGDDKREWAMAFSPDGTLLASASHDGLVRLCAVSTGKEVFRFPQVADPHAEGRVWLDIVAFSPDGRTVVTGGTFNDCSIRLWDVDTRRNRWTVDLRHYVETVAFSPDGRSVAGASIDGKCGLWEVATGKERTRFVGHLGYVTALAFSPDGRTLASGSMDTTALLWDVYGLHCQGTAAPPGRSERDWDRLWTQLSDQDGALAFTALKSFAATPKATLAFLAAHLQPVPEDVPTRIRQLLADLDDDQFAVRQKAQEELEKAGANAEPAVRQALANRPSAEARRRLDLLLPKLSDPAGSLHSLQSLRAIEVLELLGSPEAQKILAKLADGSPRSWITREAKASLKRLAQRPRAGR